MGNQSGQIRCKRGKNCPENYLETIQVGVKISDYASVLKHLVSGGFIAIGTEEEHSFNGFSAEMCLRYLERLDKMSQLPDGKENFCLERWILSEWGLLDILKEGLQ